MDLGSEEAVDQLKRSDESILKCWVWGQEDRDWCDCRGLVDEKTDAKAKAQAFGQRMAAADQKAALFKAKIGDTAKTSGLEGWASALIDELATDAVQRALYFKAYKLSEKASGFQAMLQKRRVRLFGLCSLPTRVCHISRCFALPRADGTDYGAPGGRERLRLQQRRIRR